VKELVYAICAAHVLWIVGYHVYDKLFGSGMRREYFHYDRMEELALKMNKYWSSGRFRREQAQASNLVKVYRDVYAKPEYALLDFKGKRKYAKQGVIFYGK